MASLLMTVPYDLGGDVGKEYNNIMRNTVHDWVGFADHDIFFANSDWYKMFSHAIGNLPEAGFISCYTNRIGCPLQRVEAEKGNDDIKYHRKRAKELQDKYWNDFEDITGSRFCPSALVFITSRTAWETVGGFKEDGLLGVDTNYVSKLKRAGFKIMLLKGLYVYHFYRGKP